jgi:prepilin-type N-terminal cleavage/methylation domain-containing protein
MKRAFTLIEMVAVLLLVGVLTVTATVALVPVAEAFIQVRRNSDAMQKAGFAMMRLSRELTTVTNMVAGTSHTLTYDLLDEEGQPRRHTLTWSGAAGTPLRLEGATLMDDVGSFEVRYYALPDGAPQPAWTSSCREIELAIGLASVPNVYFLRIRPRNMP